MFGSCFVMQYFVSFQVLEIISVRKRELIAFLLLCY